MRITAIVSDRSIQTSVDGTQVGGIGVDTLTIQFRDSAWEGFEHYAVWFAISGKACECDDEFHPEPVFFDYSSEVTITELPDFKTGQLRLTIDAWDGDGTGHHQLTERMRRGIAINRHGAHSFKGDEASATIQKLVKSAEDADAATERSEAQVQSAILAEQERGAEFIENEASRQAAFSQSQTERSGQFAEFMDEADDDIVRAVASAETAATAANNAADDLAQRVQAGEFNGAAFSIKYTPASIAAMNAITGMKQGEFACITSNVQDPDNAKLFMYGNGQWNYITDMSGATGIQGAQGVQGVSLEAVSMLGTVISASKYDPSTQQHTVSVVGDLAQPITDAVEARVGREYEVMDKAEYDALTEYEIDKLYMVRW